MQNTLSWSRLLIHPHGVERAHDFLGNSANTDLIHQAKEEPGQALVPTPTLETNKAFFGAYLTTILKVINTRNEESSLQLSSLLQLVTRDVTKDTILCQSLNRPIYIKDRDTEGTYKLCLVYFSLNCNININLRPNISSQPKTRLLKHFV